MKTIQKAKSPKELKEQKELYHITPHGNRLKYVDVGPKMREKIRIAQEQIRNGESVVCKTREELIAFLDSL
jgi:hypothetical protein